MAENVTIRARQLTSRAGSWSPPALGTLAFRWSLVGCALLHVALAGPTLSREPIWSDEAATLAIAGQPFGEFLAALPDRQNGMLYDIVLWPLVQLAGASSAVVRAPALVATALAVVLCGAVGSRLGGRGVGSLAALLFAVHPAVVYYAQEARPYGFVLLFALLSVWLLMRALERSSGWRWAAYVASLVALAYSHDFAVLTALAHPVLVLANPDRVVRRRFFVCVAVLLAAAVPLVAFIPDDWATASLYWVPDVGPYVVRETFGLLTGRGVYIALIALALVWPLASTVHRRRVDLLTGSWRATSIFLAVWLLVPFLVLYLISQLQPVLVDRYVLASVPALCLALSLALSVFRPPLAICLAVVAALAFLARSVEDDIRVTHPDWPGLAADLAAVRPQDEIVLLGDVIHHANALFYHDARFGIERDDLLWSDDLARVPDALTVVRARGDGHGLEGPPAGSTTWVIVPGWTSEAARAKLDSLRRACGDDSVSVRGIQVYRLSGCDIAPSD
jgi:mannosyltransferase